MDILNHDVGEVELRGGTERADAAIYDASVADLEGLLAPYPAETLTSWSVSPAMNAPAHDGRSCIERVHEPRSVGLDLFS